MRRMPFQKLDWCVVACLLLGSCCIAEAEVKAKDYVDAQNRFQLTVPPGWEQVETEGVARFQTSDRKISFTVTQVPFDVYGPEEWTEQQPRTDQMFGKHKISEETILFSGLTATKRVYVWSGVRARVVRMYEVEVLTQMGEWAVSVDGPDDVLNSPQSPRRIEIERMIQSFQFLEPLASDLRAGLWKPSSRMETRTIRGSRRWYFVSDKLGMSILLPEGWERGVEQSPSFSQGAQTILQRPGTLASVILIRETLDASPDFYLKVDEKLIDQNLMDVRKISEERITLDGLQGVKRVRVGEDNEIKARLWTLIVSRGNVHFRITAFAPDEVFEKYAADFTEMVGSIQFLGEKYAPARRTRTPIPSPRPTAPCTCPRLQVAGLSPLGRVVGLSETDPVPSPRMLCARVRLGPRRFYS